MAFMLPTNHLEQIMSSKQGLTLTHISAQLQPCLTHKNTPTQHEHPLKPTKHGLPTPKRTPDPMKSAQVQLKVDECKPLPRSARRR